MNNIGNAFDDMGKALEDISVTIYEAVSIACLAALWQLANLLYWAADSVHPYVGEHRAPSTRARLRGAWGRFWAEYQARQRADEQMRSAIASMATWWEIRRRDYAPALARAAAA
jgi:hypothetical protein